MGRPCGYCKIDRYNIRKLRITDGSTVWARMVVYQASVVVARTTVGGAGVDEVQTITADRVPRGGIWTITWSGQTTSALSLAADAAAVQAALIALPNVGASDVSVTGGPLGIAAFVVTFQNGLGSANQPQMTVYNSFPEATVAFENTFVDGDGYDKSIIVNLALADGIVFGFYGHCIPCRLSTTSGDVIWYMDEKPLLDFHALATAPSFPRVLDAVPPGRWLGAFGQNVNSPGSVAVVDIHKNVQWEQSRSALLGVKAGNGTFFAYDDTNLMYGNSYTGSVSYDVSMASISLSVQTACWVAEERAAIIHKGFSTYFMELSGPSIYPDGISTDAGSGPAVTDIVWLRRNGRLEAFYAASVNNSALVDDRTSLSLNGRTGLLRLTNPMPDPNAVRWHDTGSRINRLWLCSDGIIGVALNRSFVTRRRYYELFKCDFDLNVLWTRRWHSAPTFPDKYTEQPSHVGIYGISGDNEHVYISGTPAYLTQQDV